MPVYVDRIRGGKLAAGITKVEEVAPNRERERVPHRSTATYVAPLGVQGTHRYAESAPKASALAENPMIWTRKVRQGRASHTR